jgi:transposase
MTYHDLVKINAFYAFNKSGGRLRFAAKMVKIPTTTLHRWKNSLWWNDLQQKPSNLKAPSKKSKKGLKQSRRPSKLTNNVIEIVKEFFTNNEHALQKDLKVFLFEKGVCISKSSVSRAISIAEFSRKRLSSHILGKQNPEKVKEFINEYNPIVTSSEHVIVSTDEMYISEKVVPTHIYSKIGCKRGLTKKTGTWKQRSLIQSIASDGSKYHEVVQGTVNRTRFRQYIENLPYPQGSVILMDNCTIHKNINDVFESKGYIPIYLSPYSPEFQPVEFAFSKIKGDFRHQYPWVNGVEECLQKSIDSITVENIKRYFQHTFKNINNYVVENNLID